VRTISKVIFNFSSPLHVSVQTDHLLKDDCCVVVVSYVPSEGGPFGPKHVKDLRS
jgi:hypothetical protein